MAVGEMHNQRVVGGAPFGLEDFGDSSVLRGQRAETVDSLCRKPDGLAAAKSSGSSIDVSVAVATPDLARIACSLAVCTVCIPMHHYLAANDLARLRIRHHTRRIEQRRFLEADKGTFPVACIR
eukprot:CAMPEP_0179411778 /NCGR_PEP_ID=MMETSP0799-20121207/4093_1 /TAXON_ID=46947 /ORGANISM="Geminigera cryophila, Strain CCMP2564" /LENGTH=123 /DNA_ID=CAMNT_0021183899 /DNA_START=414 /DNA_END=785 /DNA_ORIENTATION=-